jgi:HEAT repeats
LKSLPTLNAQPADPFRVSSGDQDRAGTLPDLPSVEPPSAGFVVQLFVIPAAVVVVVIIVWLLFGKLAGGERDAMEYVRQLRSPTANWRLAFELASLIQHDGKIGSDPLLLGELSDLLSHDLDQPDADPKLTQYLVLTLGAFRTLEAKSNTGQVIDPLVPLAQALSTKYATPIRIAAAASMAKQAARLEGKLEDPGAVKALGEAAAAGEPEARQMAVYALGFFGGNAAAESLRERVKQDEDRYVRFNAAVALGRRGDLAAAGTLREMLSTADLSKVVVMSSDTEKHNRIEAIELEAMGALRTSLSSGSPELARSLIDRITDLSKSGLISVRSQAMELLQSLQSKP